MRRVKQLLPALLGFGVLVALNGDVARAANTAKRRTCASPHRPAAEGSTNSS